MGGTMQYVGHNGQIELLDDRLIIRRKGFIAFFMQGFKGDKGQ